MDIATLVATRLGEKNSLYGKYVNPAAVRSARMLGVSREYVRGLGAYLYDSSGNRYLDCDAGSGVFNLGRNHPAVRDALDSILKMATPNMVHRNIPLLAGIVAEVLADHTPHRVDRALFTVSGSETTEAALKCARRLTERPRFLYLEGDYHGGTYGALSVTDADFARREFGPMLPGCTRIPAEDLNKLQAELETRDAAAFIVEPVQGLTVRALSTDYLLEAQRMCRAHGTMFILDEVFTGFGRTGALFASHRSGLTPDMLLLSKAMSGGYVPIGAVMMRDEIHARLFDQVGSFVHGSTFEHNDFGLAAALATITTIVENELSAHAATMGQYLAEGLQALRERYDMIAAVRGHGLLFGMELRSPDTLWLRLSGKVLEKKGFLGHLVMMQLLSNHRIIATAVSRNNLLRFTPPLVITEDDVRYLLDSLENVLRDLYRFPDGISRSLVTHLLKMALRES